LKKRTKKLLIFGMFEEEPIARHAQPGDESFLVLFFKKEQPSFRLA